MPVIEAPGVQLTPAEEDLLVRLASKIGQRFRSSADRPNQKVLASLVIKGLVVEVAEGHEAAWEITLDGRRRVTTIY